MSVVYKQLIVKYGADIRDAIAGAERLDAAISKANKDIESRFGALTGKLRSVGMTMSAAITAPITMAGLAAVNNAVHMETLRRSLDAVTGSSEQTAIQMKQLQEVAKLPGIGYKEAIQLAVGLQATGLAASEAQRYMKAFGNAIATVGGGKEELSAVSRQLQQMAGKKSPMMQDIRIIQEYVPQMLQAMKKLYGTTDTEQIQKMGIETKQFLSDIVGELENLPKVTSGTKIAIENLQDQWFRFSSAIGERAIPALVKITEVAASAMEQFNKLPVPMQLAAIGAVALTAAAGPLLLALAALPSAISGVTIVLPVLTAIVTTMISPLGWAGTAILAFAATFEVLKNSIKNAEEQMAHINDELPQRSAVTMNKPFAAGEEEKLKRYIGRKTQERTKARDELNDMLIAHYGTTEVDKAFAANPELDVTGVAEELRKSGKKRGTGVYRGRFRNDDELQILIAQGIGEYKRTDSTVNNKLEELKSRQDATTKLAQSMPTDWDKQATAWKLVGLAATQAGEELKSAWAKINESYASALAKNAESAENAASEGVYFDKALADKIALEQYKADKAEYFRNKMKTEQDRQETAIREAEENQRKVLADRKQATDNIFTAMSLDYAKQGISADSRGDEIGAAIASANEQFAQEYGRAAQAQLDGNPNWQRMIELAEMKRAEAIAKARDNARAKAAAEATTEKSAAYTLASMQASMNADEMQHLVEQTPLTSTQKLEVTAAIAGEQEAAAINTALASYTQKLNELNELKLKGIDVTNQAKQAELELQKAYVDAARARQKAIEQEVEALRQRKEQQIGFSSLTDMWRKGMIAGAREEFGDYAGRQRERAMAEVSMKQNAQGTREARDTEMVGLLREQVKKLTDMVGELKKQTPILKQAGVLQ